MQNPLTKREFYIPKGATRVAMKSGGAEFWLYENNAGQPCACCFVGRAQKPTWRFRFLDRGQRESRIKAQIAAVEAKEKAKAARKAEASKPHGWEAGLILSGSWGYDQTNVDFFEVTRVIGKTMVEIEKIGSQDANDAPGGYSSMSSHVVPDPDARTGRTYRVKVSRNSCRSPVHGWLSPWCGKPRYCSWYA